MKVGDLVRTPEGKLGIITKYYSIQHASANYPWYVSIMPDWSIEYFKTEQLEVISESRRPR